jgi:adenylylsulfate kinase
MSFDVLNKNNVYWQELIISKKTRRKINGHGSIIVWLTGLSASGKTTIAKLLEKRLYEYGSRTYVLDGDNLRHGLNKDLGFSEGDRRENIRRIGEVAKLFIDAGSIVICAFISPYREDRKMIRDLVEANEFIEIYVKCSLDVCIQRDPKGLYKKALSQEITHFTGIDDPYEEPEEAEIVLENDELKVEESVEIIFNYLKENGHLKLSE